MLRYYSYFNDVNAIYARQCRYFSIVIQLTRSPFIMGRKECTRIIWMYRISYEEDRQQIV